MNGPEILIFGAISEKGVRRSEKKARLLISTSPALEVSMKI